MKCIGTIYVYIYCNYIYIYLYNIYIYILCINIYNCIYIHVFHSSYRQEFPDRRIQTWKRTSQLSRRPLEWREGVGTSAVNKPRLWLFHWEATAIKKSISYHDYWENTPLFFKKNINPGLTLIEMDVLTFVNHEIIWMFQYVSKQRCQDCNKFMKQRCSTFVSTYQHSSFD